MKVNKIILIVISILVPAVVASLFLFRTTEANLGSWVYSLPQLNVTLNATTIVLLIAALIMIKKGKEKAHRNLMLTALFLGTLFLISYITYHASVPSTVYGDLNHDHTLSQSELMVVGSWRSVYLVLLLSHILVAVSGLPLVLIAVYHGLKGNRTAHKKIVKFTFPVWLYISITGVIVYFLISPYY